MSEADHEHFFMLHDIARKALILLRCSPVAEPGFKGLIEEFDLLCKDTLEQHQKQQGSK